MTDTIRQLSDAYSKSEPNELEQRLTEQKAGYIPPDMMGWVMDHLPPNHPLRQQLKDQVINGVKEGNA